MQLRGLMRLRAAPRRGLCMPLPQHIETSYNKWNSSFEFNKENLSEIDRILAKYPSNYKQSGIIPLLWLAQRQNDNWIPLAAMNKIAEIVGVAPIRVYETCCFYTMFNRQPIGKYHIQLCGTTPCMIRGAQSIRRVCEEEIGAEAGHTSKDKMFTLTEVECLGACVNAPMVQINDDYYEDLDENSMRDIIRNLRDGKETKPGPQNGRNQSEGINGRTSLFEVTKPPCRDLDEIKKELEADK